MTPRGSTPDPSEATPVDVAESLGGGLSESLHLLLEDLNALGERLDSLSELVNDLSVGHEDSFDEADGFPNVVPHPVRRPEIRRRHLGGSDQRGTTLILALALCAIFAAVVLTCLLATPDVQPILEQVDESVGQFIGGAW